MTAGGTDRLNESDTNKVTKHEQEFEKSFDEYLPSPEHSDRSLALNKSSNNYDVDGKSKADDSLHHDPSGAIQNDDDTDTCITDVKTNLEPILKSRDVKVTEPVQKAHDELTLHWINMCTETRDELKQIGIQLMNANICLTNTYHNEGDWMSENENQQKSLHVLENRIKHLRDTTDIDMFKCIADPVGVETPDTLLFRTADSFEKDFGFMDTVIKRWEIIRIEINSRDAAMSQWSITTLCKDYANTFGDDCKFVSQTMIELSSSRNADDETHNMSPRIPEISEVKVSTENVEHIEYQKATPKVSAYVLRDPEYETDAFEYENELFLVPTPPCTPKPKNTNFRRNRKTFISNPAVAPTKKQTKVKDYSLNELSQCSWPLGLHNEHLYLGTDPRMGKNKGKFLTNKPSKIPVNTVFIIRDQYKSAALGELEKNWPIGLHNVKKFLGFDPRQRGYKADRIDGGKTRIPISTAYILRKMINDQYLKKKLGSKKFLNRKDSTSSPKYTRSHMSADDRNCFNQKEKKPKIKREHNYATKDAKESCYVVNRDTSSITLPAIHRPRKAEASRLHQRNSDIKHNSMSEISLPKIRGVYTYTDGGESSLSHHSFDGPSQRRKGMLRTRW